jgi:hypothetical protein
MYNKQFMVLLTNSEIKALSHSVDRVVVKCFLLLLE